MDLVERYSDLLACLTKHAKENPPSKLEQKSFVDEILTPYFSNCLQDDKMAHESFMVEESEEPEIETLEWTDYKDRFKNLKNVKSFSFKSKSEFNVYEWMSE